LGPKPDDQVEANDMLSQESEKVAVAVASCKALRGEKIQPYPELAGMLRKLLKRCPHKAGGRKALREKL